MANSTAVITRLALPKGKMLARTAEFLNAIGLGFDDYNSKTRIYRMQSQKFSSLTAKMLNERDIPVQVAIGNYDVGICSSDWLQELQARYPVSRVFKIADLGFDRSQIFLACSAKFKISLEEMATSAKTWRIVTEYPALAEAAAYKMRLKKFRIFPLWGSAEAYPPENADLAILKVNDEKALKALNLLPVCQIAESSACIVANRDSLQTGDFSEILNRFTSGINLKDKPWLKKEEPIRAINNEFTVKVNKNNVWLALADGHQQAHTTAFLDKTEIKLDGYSKDSLRRRPSCNLDWLDIKVIRPQDMPQQVANGNFDLAITGKDWLLDHLYQFPSSPVMELVNLGFGWVRVVAVVSEDVPADSIEGIRRLISKGQMTPLRIATEYVNIADKFLRDKHIARYRVIPTWGATEVYLPEDADMLIENTETGQTLARHNLKIIDTLFESTACLIGNRRSLEIPAKRKKIEDLMKIFREAAGKK
ncbi:MAG: ATP phosphoribosyltransferase [Chloroflexi bacterium]|nr:ATP phosphoribosyltransferase [Chloroflexota bacterium]